MSTATLAPTAGWYPDPAGLVDLRYFDGMSWTSETRTHPSTVPAISAGWHPDPSGNESLLRYHDGSDWTHQIAPAPRKRAISVDVARSEATAPLERPEAPLVDAEPTGGILSRLRLSENIMGNIALVLGIVLCLYFFSSLGMTNIMGDLEQRELQEELAASVPAEAVPIMVAPADAASIPASAPPVAQKPAEPVVPEVPLLTLSPKEGAPVARIKIPSLDVDTVVVAGTTVPALKTGPGIWRDGAFPGMPGNATISGHRTTYGGPFRNIDKLKTGDQIIVSVAGEPDAVFEVRGTIIVEPSRIEVTESTPGVRITLTTCDPVGSDAARLVVQAELVEGTHVKEALPAAEWKIQS